ncbi:hypothetical protein FA95DRAFT_1569344 [Auriscalpium vulgare]|uniref:Uncharacterized protein n=1 Tax=Auriscalpium vulgare TaxID=40419 RepID=A0ACB8S8H2_9AGAM|nr:hypothetical protein FA95DRAFT_1569344 [Auriscalpium vulgare]
MDHHPPPYSSAHNHSSHWSLPAYTSGARSGPSTSSGHQTEHRYSLGSKPERPWITLKVRSYSPNANLLPLFYEGDTISGSVSLDLTKSDAVREVSVTLQATVSITGQQALDFLNIPQILFAQSSGKLHGTHSWPFAIALPREVTLGNSMRSAHTFCLPPRFSEPHSFVHIDYRIVATVKRHKFAVNSSVLTNAVYLPRIIAEPPSAPREVAYREGTLPPGPELDPDGWKALPPIDIRGRLFSTKPVNVRCTLAIATPLTFAINCPIPFHLTLASTDPVALDLLSDPRAVAVRLLRSVEVSGAPPAHARQEEVIGTAVFWPTTDGVSRGDGVKRLSGEVLVRKRLSPSFTFDKVTVRYVVALYSFQAPGFAPDVPASEQLVAEEVRVTLRNFHGIVPRSYAPPGALTGGDSSSAEQHPRYFYMDSGPMI